MYGFKGNVLFLDAGRRSHEIRRRDGAFFKKYIGGALLCTAVFDELTAGAAQIDPFSPENPLVFATGPMAGDGVCGATRVNLLSIAPESAGIYLSQAGGEFGPSLKRAGFDALALIGKSDTPLLIVIDNESVKYIDATHLWGKDRLDARKQIIDELGPNFSVACIGPAGENLVRHANIMFEPEHYAGRGGLGAVLGAKRIKAIAVRGDQGVIFSDPARVKAINKRGGHALMQKIKASPKSFMGILRNLGTFGLLELNRKMGNLPTRNFACGSPDDPDAVERLTRRTAQSEFVGRINPCKNCFVACKKRSKAHPEYTGLAEYESAAILGPNIGLEKDMKTSLAACELCNRLGLDTISTGDMIAWLMDCFENGVLTEDKTGFSITFGKGEKVIELIKDIALRRDEIGNLLADGVEQAVRALGPETRPYLRFIKGIGIPAHMPRKKPGVGFSYLHGPNVNDHMKLEHDWIASDPASLEAFQLNVRSSPDALDEAKIEVARATQIYYAAMDALSLCLFVFGPGNVYTVDETLDLVNAATGFNLGFEELMEIGERTIQMQRRLFLHLGGRDEDLLPFMTTEIPAGPSKGARIKKQDFDRARRHYYTAMGWDEKGVPKPETLARLGI